MSIKSIVNAYDTLSRLDLRVLRVVEVGHRKFEHVPVDIVTKWVDKDSGLITKSLRKLHSLGMLIRWKGSYTGYRLTYIGYDILALHTLVKKNILTRLSPTPIGIGKESDVYVGENELGGKIIVKFHRLGRTSFRHTRKFRTYVGDRRHTTWLYVSRLSAHMEYKALILTYNNHVNVPEPITINRHAVVMKYVNGVQLSELKTLTKPEIIFEEIIESVRKTYRNVGIVHADLSKFNIIIESEKPYIIDWCQFIPRNCKESINLLRRDITNIVEYFVKDQKLSIDVEEVIKYVTENVEVEELEVEEAFRRIISDEELKRVIEGAKDLEDTELE